jgi:hypothetical protein
MKREDYVIKWMRLSGVIDDLKVYLYHYPDCGHANILRVLQHEKNQLTDIIFPEKVEKEF